MLWPKFENEKIALNLAYTGTIKEDVIDCTQVAFYLTKLLFNNYKQNLCERYKIEEELPKEDSNEEILELMYTIGRKRGAILPGGKIDEEKTSKLILEDFRSGKIGKITIEKVKGK